MDEDFKAITDGLEIHLTYAALEISESAPEAIRPNRRNRQWALVDPEGKIAALGPATGGGKSAFIAYAAQHEGFTVAHRWVESGSWVRPE